MIDATNKSRLLRRCNHHPRSLEELTVGDFVNTVITRHMPIWVAELTEHGYLEERDGKYKTSAAGRAYLNVRPSIAESRTFRAEGVYTGERWNIRENADTSHLKSYGAGC